MGCKFQHSFTLITHCKRYLLPLWGQVRVYCWFRLILIVIWLVPYRQEGLALPLNWSELRISELRTNQTQSRTELRYSNRSLTDFGRFTIFWTSVDSWFSKLKLGQVRIGLTRFKPSLTTPNVTLVLVIFVLISLNKLNFYMQLFNIL